MLSNKDSGFLIFYDENQDIFGRWNKLPAWADGFAKKVLRRNCRNTINITKYLEELIPSEQSPVGKEVKVVTFTRNQKKPKPLERISRNHFPEA